MFLLLHCFYFTHVFFGLFILFVYFSFVHIIDIVLLLSLLFYAIVQIYVSCVECLFYVTFRCYHFFNTLLKQACSKTVKKFVSNFLQVSKTTFDKNTPLSGKGVKGVVTTFPLRWNLYIHKISLYV